MDAPAHRSHGSTIGFATGCVAALLLVLGAYSNSLNNSFHFDDSHVIEDNIFVRDVRNIPRFFTDARTFSSIPTNATYRPIVSATLAVDYRLAHGLVPRAFHVTQITLLILVGAMLAALIFTLLNRVAPSGWNRWTALFATTFFCVHTGNTQPVNYISARSELLAALGILGALLVYVCAPRARRYQLHLLPMMFGVLAKTPAVITAPLLLAYDLLIERQVSIPELFTRRAWPRVRAALLSTAPAFIAAAALYRFVEGMNPAGQTYGGGGRLRYLTTETWVWVHYARMFLLPTGLSADTDLELFRSALDVRVAAGIIFLVALIAVACVASTRARGKIPAFGIAWFWIGLIPSSTVLPLAEVANDHRVFFPFAGLSLAVSAWLAQRFETAAIRLRSRVPIVMAAAIALSLIGAHAAGTYQRNRVWRSEETLWADVVKKSPKNGRGLMNYGLTRMQRADYAGAKQLFVEAERLDPNYALLEVNLAVAENGLGNVAAADSHFTRALALNPHHPAPHLYYARWLMRRSRAPEAIPHLVRTLELSPADLEARHMLMSLYAACAAPELHALAVETLRFASSDTIADRLARGIPEIQVDTPTRTAWFAMGTSLGRQDRHIEAAQAYRAALAIDSTDADARNNLGWSLAQLGFYEDAVTQFRAALRLDPGSTRTARNLSWALGRSSDARFQQAVALQQSGQSGSAIEIYRDLLLSYPRWVNARYNLGYALMKTDHPADAVDAFRRALELDPGLNAAHLHLSTCLQRLGRVDDAAREAAMYRAAAGRTTAPNDPRRPARRAAGLPDPLASQR